MEDAETICKVTNKPILFLLLGALFHWLWWYCWYQRNLSLSSKASRFRFKLSAIKERERRRDKERIFYPYYYQKTAVRWFHNSAPLLVGSNLKEEEKKRSEPAVANETVVWSLWHEPISFPYL